MAQSSSQDVNISLASQEIPAFYETIMFITGFSTPRHLSLS